MMKSITRSFLQCFRFVFIVNFEDSDKVFSIERGYNMSVISNKYKDADQFILDPSFNLGFDYIESHLISIQNYTYNPFVSGKQEIVFIDARDVDLIRDTRNIKTILIEEYSVESIKELINQTVKELVENTNIILPFSSGWDSTLTLLKLVDEGFKYIRLTNVRSINIPASKKQASLCEVMCHKINDRFSTDLKIYPQNCDATVLENHHLKGRYQLPFILFATSYMIAPGFNVIIRPLISSDEYTIDMITNDKNAFLSQMKAVYPDQSMKVDVIYPFFLYKKADVIDEVFSLEKKLDLSLHPYICFTEDITDDKLDKSTMDICNALKDVKNEEAKEFIMFFLKSHFPKKLLNDIL